MNKRQRQTILFVGFLTLLTIVTVFLLQNSSADGPGLGGIVPDGVSQFFGDMASIYGDMFNDAKKVENVTG